MSLNILKAHVICRRIDDDKIVYEAYFDPDLIDLDELILAIRLAKILKCRCCRRRIIERYGEGMLRRMRREYESIIRKAIKGNLMCDPPLQVALNNLFRPKTPRENISYWWCCYPNKGKYFTEMLSANPYTVGNGRSAVALNPYGLDSLSDLDTIIDQLGYHKEGSIGVKPFSIDWERLIDSIKFVTSFVGASNTKILSIILLNASYYEDTTGGSASTYFPAPPGTCHGSAYSPIYIDVWGMSVDIDVVEGYSYGLTIRLYK